MWISKQKQLPFRQNHLLRLIEKAPLPMTHVFTGGPSRHRQECAVSDTWGSGSRHVFTGGPSRHCQECAVSATGQWESYEFVKVSELKFKVQKKHLLMMEEGQPGPGLL